MNIHTVYMYIRTYVPTCVHVYVCIHVYTCTYSHSIKFYTISFNGLKFYKIITCEVTYMYIYVHVLVYTYTCTYRKVREGPVRERTLASESTVRETPSSIWPDRAPRHAQISQNPHCHLREGANFSDRLCPQLSGVCPGVLEYGGETTQCCVAGETLTTFQP